MFRSHGNLWDVYSQYGNRILARTDTGKPLTALFSFMLLNPINNTFNISFCSTDIYEVSDPDCYLVV